MLFLVDYAGHQKDPGYNAIFAINAMNIWVKDVTVLNADNAVNFVSVDFSTVSGVTVGMTRDRSVPVSSDSNAYPCKLDD